MSLELHFESGLGCWAVGWAWAGLGGQAGWAGLVIWAGNEPGTGGGLGGLGWAALANSKMKRKLVYSKMATLCPDRKSERSNGQQQQAISIYFFLEGLGFGV